MIKKSLLILMLAIGVTSQAQELNAQVQILTPTIQTSNQTLFTNMQKAIENFLNFTTWTEETYSIEEKISCSFVMTINSVNNTNYSATLQVNYSRPIYNSNYNSPVLNYIDNNFSFQYLENQPLEFIQNSFQSNLTSVLSYYAFVIIGLDKDTYSLKGGQAQYLAAQNIVNMAQSESERGWKSFDGSKNRFWLIDNILNDGYGDVRYFLYNYHRLGLDLMYQVKSQAEAKKKIANAIIALRSVYEKRPNAFILQLLFDAKSNEIISIFSTGPAVETSTLITTLKKIDASRSSKYEQISR